MVRGVRAGRGGIRCDGRGEDDGVITSSPTASPPFNARHHIRPKPHQVDIAQVPQAHHRVVHREARLGVVVVLQQCGGVGVWGCRCSTATVSEWEQQGRG